MLIQIIDQPGRGKSQVAWQIARMLEEAGAKVVVKDDMTKAQYKRILDQVAESEPPFSTIIKALRGAFAQSITIRTVQANRLSQNVQAIPKPRRRSP